MNKKKQFKSPRVVQEVRVLLETDLLQGPSMQYDSTAILDGQAAEDYDLSTDEYTSAWD